MDEHGNVYIADMDNHRIRKVSAVNSTITTIAGTGHAGYNGDRGPATQAQLHFPSSVDVDGHGNVYISDTKNFRVRKVLAP